jgi:hypothetical protein
LIGVLLLLAIPALALGAGDVININFESDPPGESPTAG